jgi:hypothetical protein
MSLLATTGGNTVKRDAIPCTLHSYLNVFEQVLMNLFDFGVICVFEQIWLIGNKTLQLVAVKGGKGEVEGGRRGEV